MSSRPGSLKIVARVGFATSLLLLGFSACTATRRPTLEQWQPRWDEINAVIPTETQMTGTPDKALCEQTVAALRTRSVDLLPSPDVALDASVRTWLEIAEDAFFDCPPAGDSNIASFPDAYAEMSRLASEIELVLATGS